MPSWISAGWFAVYLALQSYAVAGLPTPRFPDSYSYFPLSFSGADPRLWTVPLFYRILPNDPLRIAGQVIVAAVAWWMLAAVVSGMLVDRRLQVGARLLLLALGLAGPIVEWNSTILSESLSISLTALLVAGWLSYLRRPRSGSAAVVVVVTLLWTFSRSDHVAIGLLIAAVAVVAAVRRRSVLRLALAFSLVLVGAFGAATVGRNHTTYTSQVADLVEVRVLPDPARLTWFRDHGMPYDTTMAKATGGYFGAPLLSDPTFAHWAATRGEPVYREYVVTHPGYALWDPLATVSGERPSLDVPAPAEVLSPNPTPSLLSPTANYGRHRDLLPDPVDELLVEQGQIGDLIAVALAAAVLVGMARRRRLLDWRVIVPTVALACCVPEFYLVWLADPIELDRHGVVLSVAVRIALWVLVAVTADALLTNERPPNGDPEAHEPSHETNWEGQPAN